MSVFAPTHIIINNNAVNRELMRFSVASLVSCYSCVPPLVPCALLMPLVQLFTNELILIIILD